MMFLLCGSPELTIKSKVQHPEHIERGKHSRDDTNYIHAFIMYEYMGQYFVFRKETCKRRYTRNGYGADKHGYKSYLKLAFQTTHQAHVLLVAHGVDHRTGTKE